MNVAEYTDYFRQLAVQHTDLRHNPLSETGDAPVGEKHFGRYGGEEVISGLRTKIAWPALLIEMYENKTSAENVFAVRSNYAGAFSIYASANPENTNEQEAAFILTERILYEILARIWQDHYGSDADECARPFKSFDFASLNIVPVGPVFDRQFGWRCEFSFDFNNLKTITEAPAEGTFIIPEIPE